MHLKRSRRLKKEELETLGLEKSISCFYFLLFLDQPTHYRLTGYIHFFFYCLNCIRMFVCSLHLTCLFPYMPPPPHLVNFFFFFSFTTLWPSPESFALLRVFSATSGVFHTSSSILLFTSFSSGFGFLWGLGGFVWRRDGLAWLCKSGFREEFVMGKGVMHGRLG